MGDIKGFLKVKRQSIQYRPVCERIKDFREVSMVPSAEQSQEQASRCMDCGTPFCHWKCPLGSYIPEWNDLMFGGHWQRAFELLEAANNLPEITGRVCPAPCEYACVLDINDERVTIRENELAIAEYAFQKGFIKPVFPTQPTGKKVAVIGSGPAGLSCAAQLNKFGHQVVVFERDSRIGGILRYGIPDFKLEKWVIDRRIGIWKKEGIEFRTNTFVGTNYPVSKLLNEFDTVCLAGGSRVPRDLKVEGRNLQDIHFAMDFLTQFNQKIAGQKIPADKLIDVKGKKVVIIGGGDTGSDCLGAAHRQGAVSVVQIELLPQPPESRSQDYPWPMEPVILKTSTSHEEGGERLWSVLTKKFIGENGRLAKLSCVKVEFVKESCPVMKEIPGTQFEIEADLVILAMGFVYPEKEGLLDELKVRITDSGNVATDENYATSFPGVFAAGDIRRGASLVVWAIAEGRGASRSIDRYLSRF